MEDNADGKKKTGTFFTDGFYIYPRCVSCGWPANFPATNTECWSIFHLHLSLTVETRCDAGHAATMLRWRRPRRKAGRLWVRGSGPLPSKCVGGSVLCSTRQWLHEEISNPPTPGSVCVWVSKVTMCCREGLSCFTQHGFYYAHCARVLDGCAGRTGNGLTKSFHFHQLQGISHTSSIFFQQQRSTAALGVCFPLDFNWAQPANGLMQWHNTQLQQRHANRGPAAKTLARANTSGSQLIANRPLLTSGKHPSCRTSRGSRRRGGQAH